jgi:uncharacterized membrane protein YjgN (DUF898 family)
MRQSSDRLVRDGGAVGLLGLRLVACVITIGTLGFGFPVGFVLVRRQKARHLTRDGRRLEFTGSARELFRDWLPWWMLTLGTLGVYGLWVYPMVAGWAREHLELAPLRPWEYDATPAEPVRPLAAPIRLSLGFFTETGMHQLVG